jgi:hypothetical protein
MKSTPFVQGTDLEPIPFTENLCQAAKRLKAGGLDWRPHVGCFVWDESGAIKASSPLPNRIYFILNLNHFIRIFHSIEGMKNALVWLPTWHQTKLLCRRVGLSTQEIEEALRGHPFKETDGDLIALYELLRHRL